ncbi:MAG: sensor histidine kinase, partial [Rhodospirillaceae bacterium]
LHAQKNESLRTAATIHERQCQQLTALLDDLLDVARITRDRIELKLQRVDLRDCVQDAADENVPCIEAKDQVLDIAVPAEPLMAMVDRTRITQIISNLVNNACKYSANGARVEVRAELIGDRLQISVTDTGTGIPQEMLPHIFEAFYVQPAAHPGQHGLGLGLWLCSQLARLHGGDLRAFSEGRGKGARFELRLPPDAAPSPSTRKTMKKEEIRYEPAHE